MFTGIPEFLLVQVLTVQFINKRTFYICKDHALVMRKKLHQV